MTLARRKFLASTAMAGLATPILQTPILQAADRFNSDFHKRPKVAVVMTVMTYRSHAHVILENFLYPFLFNGKRTEPGVDVVSFYVDQFPQGDMARKTAKDFGIPLFDSIDGAICLGGKRPAVDAVLSIGEHGSYPHDKLGRHQYPRKRFFDEIIQSIRKGDRGLPLFNDKHLSYRWDWTREMYDLAQQNDCPLMAGSSVPLAQRIPNLELKPGSEFEEALSIHGGGVESYDFHGLETLQSMIEIRKGGETGISSLQFLDSAALQKSIAEGEISRQLFEAAMKTVDPKHQLRFEKIMPNAHGILLRYADGLKASCISIKQITGTRWPFACKLKDKKEIDACRFFVGPWNNRNLFKALSHAIQTHFRQGQAPYPVERTLLTSGAVNAVMDSRHAGGKELKTPNLEIKYEPRDFRAMRELGDSWKILTEKSPQPKGLFQQFK